MHFDDVIVSMVFDYRLALFLTLALTDILLPFTPAIQKLLTVAKGAQFSGDFVSTSRPGVSGWLSCQSAKRSPLALPMAHN